MQFRLLSSVADRRYVCSLVTLLSFFLCALPLQAEIDLLLFHAAQTAGEGTSASNPSSSNPQDEQTAPASQGKSAAALQVALEEYRRQVDRLTAAQQEGSKGKGLSSKVKDYHGNFYEYLRNDVLDALPHEVRQADGEKSVLRRNQFGFNLTGPLRIPWLYRGDGKTFFSITYEGTREKISRPHLMTIPTTPQRSGDFSDLIDDAGEPVKIYDPATTRPNPKFDPLQPVSLDNLQYLRDPFPGNIIPRERLDPVALNALAYYPLPNASVGPFLRNNFFTNSVETNTPNGTVWKLDHNLSSRHKFSWSSRFSSGLDGAAPVFENPANPGTPPRRVRSRSASLGETFNISPTIVNQFHVSAWYSSLEPQGQEEPAVDYASSLGLKGVQAGLFPRLEMWPYVNIGAPPGALIRYQMAGYAVSDGLSVRHKKHNLKANFSAYWSQVNSIRPRNPAGRFTFNGELTALPGINNTGNPFAQFLLGLSNRAEQSITLRPSYFRTDQYQLGFSDEYQLSPNFNWNFSLGLQIDDSRSEKYNHQSSLDLKMINPANGRPGALFFAGHDGRPRTFSPRQFNWRPSVGWTLNPGGSRKTVIRGGYSIYFENFPLFPTDFGTLGFNAVPLYVSANAQLSPVMTLRDGFPQDFVHPPDLRPTAANGLRANYFDPLGILPYVQNWRWEIERDLPADFVVRLSYHGNKGSHLFVGNGLDLNALSPDVLGFRDRLNDLEFNYSLRPYPQYREIITGYGYPIGSSTAHQGSLRAEKKLSHGLNFSAAYTLSKLLDDVTDEWMKPQNSTNLKPEKALTPWDITHRFTLNYLYELPFGSGRSFWNEGGWKGGVLGGWSVSGVGAFHTGSPVILRPLFNNTGGVAEDLRVNVVPGFDPHVENPSPFEWFNPAAFDQPPDFALGNGPRTHPSLRNPGDRNYDMSLTKRMPVTEDWTLELIVEAFNALNHANLNAPDNMIGSKENPNLNAGKIIGSTGGRVVQLGLRLSF